MRNSDAITLSNTESCKVSTALMMFLQLDRCSKPHPQNHCTTAHQLHSVVSHLPEWYYPAQALAESACERAYVEHPFKFHIAQPISSVGKL